MRRFPMLLLLPIAAALMVPSDAHAYKHLGDTTGGSYMVWGPDQMPIPWVVSVSVDETLPQAIDPITGLLYQELVMIKSYCNWRWTEYCEDFDFLTNQNFGNIHAAAECASLDFVYEGQTSDIGGSKNDGIRTVYFADPGDELDSQTNGHMVPWRGNTVVMEQNGNEYYAFNDTDIAFSNQRDWGTDPGIEQTCSGEFSIEATATHEVGHALGLGHSCDDGDPCQETELKNATMFWQGGACATDRSDINSDDIAGLEALYGGFATFYTDSSRFGGAPLTADFKISSEDNVISADWRFGDGTTSTELEPSHTYEIEGQFTVSADFLIESEICGESEFKARELAYMLVCAPPLTEFSFEQLNGLTYQMVNSTPVTTYGCIDEISWEVYKGSELVETYNAWSPKIEFPSEGDYTIKLSIGGPGGGSAAELDFVVDGKGGSENGCSSVPGPRGAGFAGLLIAFGAMLRRRRD